MTAEEKKYRILGIILAAVTYAVIIVAMITPTKTVFTPSKDNYFISLHQKTKHK